MPDAHNRDVPGVVGRVGTLLGENGINIAGLELGREQVERHGALARSTSTRPCRTPCSRSCGRSPEHRLGAAAAALRRAMSTTVVIGAQWGDEGKGKIVDLLAARRRHGRALPGGNNAGHTLVVGRREDRRSTSIPSGVLHPGKVCVIGTGVVDRPGGAGRARSTRSARAATSPTTR